MKRLALIGLVWANMLCPHSEAQTLSRLCFNTNSDPQSCQNANAANPYPVTIISGGGSGANIGLTGAAVPTSANYNGLNIGGNLVGFVGGAGTEAGALRVTLPTDGTGKVIAAQATAANLNATVVGTGTFVTQSAITAASGSIASGALASGSMAAGSMVDLLTMRGTKAAGTAAANALLTGGIYTAAGITLTDGQQAALQTNASGFLKSVLASESSLNVAGATAPSTGLGFLCITQTSYVVPANGNAGPIPCPGSGGIGVTDNHIGEVGGNIISITNAITTSNATVTTGQSIGGIQTLASAVRISGAIGASGTSGIIQSLVLTFLDAVTVPNSIDVYFYNATVTTGSNCQNATTFVLQTADRTNVLGIAHITDFTSSNTAVVGQANNLALPFALTSSTNLFACVVARGSFAITGTSNASLKVNVLRN